MIKIRKAKSYNIINYNFTLSYVNGAHLKERVSSLGPHQPY